ncbi:MAG: hypothetical protein JWR69_2654 [Pedosphaera sp.]|nr:hypothetical protein [Pedosphaera sp.]
MTILFGAWAIILAKQHQYPGQLTYYAEKPIRLFNDITRNLTDINILYRGEPMTKNLVVARGYLLNTGHKDIAPEMVTAPITFKLPEGWKWRDAKATSLTVNGVAAKILDERTLSIPFQLFRKNEYVTFESLIEVPHEQSFGGFFDASHRISDTGNIKTVWVPPMPKTKSLTEVMKENLAVIVTIILFGIIPAIAGVPKLKTDWRTGTVYLMLPSAVCYGFFLVYSQEWKNAKFWKRVKPRV